MIEGTIIFLLRRIIFFEGGTLGCPVGFGGCFQVVGDVIRNIELELGHATIYPAWSMVASYDSKKVTTLFRVKNFQHDIEEGYLCKWPFSGRMLLLDKLYIFHYKKWWVFNSRPR